MFLKKKPKQKQEGEESSQSTLEKVIEKLLQENRQLRLEMSDANTRIKDLEAAVMANQSQQQHDPSPSLNPKPMAKKALHIRNKEPVDYRDDDDGYDGDRGSDNLSVEVQALDIELTTTQEEEFFDDLESTTSSARTVPTGNDQKSKFHRRQKQLRQRLRGGNRRRRNNDSDYFTRREQRRTLGSINEINTQQSLLDKYFDDDGDSRTTTSDLSSSLGASFGSSIISDDDDSHAGNSLMSGKMPSLYVMKSLLRTSSTDTDAENNFSSTSRSLLGDNDSTLFGEI